MKIELRKINVSKSIIDQIQTADTKSVFNYSDVLGWCIWNIGTSSKRRLCKLILFFNSDGEVRKIIEPSEIKDTTYKYDKDWQNPVLGQITQNRLTIKRNNGYQDQEIKFDTAESKTEFASKLRQLVSYAKAEGQFFY